MNDTGNEMLRPQHHGEQPEKLPKRSMRGARRSVSHFWETTMTPATPRKETRRPHKPTGDFSEFDAIAEKLKKDLDQATTLAAATNSASSEAGQAFKEFDIIAQRLRDELDAAATESLASSPSLSSAPTPAQWATSVKTSGARPRSENQGLVPRTTPTLSQSGNHIQGRAERAVRATATTKSPFFRTPSPPQHQGDDGFQASSLLSPPTGRKKTPRRPRGTVSSLPVPPLSATRFGLIQEEVADDPFRLLVAVTSLIKTAGRTAIPVFWQLMDRFPTPEALASADSAEIIRLIRPLGLSTNRSSAIQKYARVFLENPPRREVRYGVKNYPFPGDGKQVRQGEVFGPEDDDDTFSGGVVDAITDRKDRALGSAWEIGHVTQGPYALDSWRIFCRDVLLGRSQHWTGEGKEPEFQPEWMRVLPKDKELRACLRWMWMREGWEWDPSTGECKPLREELRKAVDEGRVGYDDGGNLVMFTCPADGSKR